jgi:dephospho-CoA kinase
MMSDYKIRQLNFESDTWRRHLAFMSDENIHMKTRLIELLKTRLETDLLNEAEKFQNLFIEQDNVIGLLRNSITEFERLLTREIYENGAIIQAVIASRISIEDKILSVKNKFEELKRKFNHFALENF